MFHGEALAVAVQEGVLEYTDKLSTLQVPTPRLPSAHDMSPHKACLLFLRVAIPVHTTFSHTLHTKKQYHRPSGVVYRPRLTPLKQKRSAVRHILICDEVS